MAPLQSLCRLMLLLATSLVASAAPPSGIRLELTHLHKSQLLRRAAQRSRLRAATLSAATPGSPGSKMHWSGSEYVVEIAIGTPPVPFAGLVDTGSELIWTQSRPCGRCAHQSTPIYDLSASRSFSLEPCSSAMSRGTRASTWTTTAAATPVHRDARGDGQLHRDGWPWPRAAVTGGAAGVRQVLLLPHQLLRDQTDQPTPLFGSLADLTAGGRPGGTAVQSTPLL
ncbi:hypothetical protein EJB05_12152, partial [Eragrostis curvula]